MSVTINISLLVGKALSTCKWVTYSLVDSDDGGLVEEILEV